MKDRPLFSVTQVLDDETGIWAGDLCEYSIHVGAVDSFLKAYGQKGMEAMELMALAVLRQIHSGYYWPLTDAGKAEGLAKVSPVSSEDAGR